MKRKALAAIIGACVAFVVTHPSTASADEGDFRVSKGHRFRVKFDPESRIRLGVAASAALLPPATVQITPEFSAGIWVRRRYAWGEGPAKVEWQFDQRILSGFIAPWVRPFGELPAFDAALYGAFAHRHDLSPRIVLPSSPPASIPFPFDVAVEGEIGRVTVPRAPITGASDGNTVPFMRVSVARATAFVDPLRSGAPGRSVEIGVGVRYDIDMYGPQAGTGPANTITKPRFVHRIAPGTVGSIRVRYETEDGIFSLDCRGEVVPHWTSEGTWKLGAYGYGRAERTLIAIDDQPIAAFVETSYRLIPPALELAAQHDVRLSLGFTFGFDLTPETRIKWRQTPGLRKASAQSSAQSSAE